MINTKDGQTVYVGYASSFFSAGNPIFLEVKSDDSNAVAWLTLKEDESLVDKLLDAINTYNKTNMEVSSKT